MLLTCSNEAFESNHNKDKMYISTASKLAYLGMSPQCFPQEPPSHLIKRLRISIAC